MVSLLRRVGDARHLQDNVKSLKCDSIQCECIFFRSRFHSIPFVVGGFSLFDFHFETSRNGVDTTHPRKTIFCATVLFSVTQSIAGKFAHNANAYQCRCTIKGFGCRSLFNVSNKFTAVRLQFIQENQRISLPCALYGRTVS